MTLKILVIDDHAPVRDMLQTYLHDCLDAEVIVSPTGSAAMKFLEEEHPDLDAIILDIMMPTHG